MKALKLFPRIGFADARRRAALGELWGKLHGEALAAQLVRGSAGAFVVKAMGAGLSLAVNIVLARALGVRDYGIFTFVYAWMMILAQVSRLGFHNSLVRFVPEYNVSGEWTLLKGLGRFSFISVAGVAGILGLGMMLCAVRYPELIGFARAPAFIIGAVALPFLALLGIEKGYLRGLKRVVFATIPELVAKPGLMLIATVLAILWLGHGALDAAEATALHGGAMALAFAVGVVFLIRSVPRKAREVDHADYDTRKWMAVSMPMLLISSMNLISHRASLIMTGFLADDAAVGILNIGLRISSLVVFGLGATNMIVAPLISELYHGGRRAELQRILTLAARGIFAFTALGSAFLIIFGPWIVGLFGKGFEQAYIPLIIMLVGQVVNASAGAVNNIMMMTGHHNQSAVIIAVSVVMNLVMAAWLVPLYGAAGAALAMSISMVFWNLTMVVYVLCNHGLNATIFHSGL